MARKSMVALVILVIALVSLEAYSAKLAEPVVRQICVEDLVGCASQSPTTGANSTCSLGGMINSTQAQKQAFCGHQSCQMCWDSVFTANICAWVWTDESAGSDYHCVIEGLQADCGKVKTGDCFWGDTTCNCPSDGPDMGDCKFDRCRLP
jgi:hypothetical protein